MTIFVYKYCLVGWRVLFIYYNTSDSKNIKFIPDKISEYWRCWLDRRFQTKFLFVFCPHIGLVLLKTRRIICSDLWETGTTFITLIVLHIRQWITSHNQSVWLVSLSCLPTDTKPCHFSTSGMHLYHPHWSSNSTVPVDYDAKICPLQLSLSIREALSILTLALYESEWSASWG